ncbi:hypothetical protein BKA69DRAFT_1123934 [Paraphysoderma sedebokerense]|nr:hypothetical protein BKA69DRAFT_1123934 [Paraphysoderma sedebokerense]
MRYIASRLPLRRPLSVLSESLSSSGSSAPPNCFDLPISIYIHYPYCLKLCTYCNFNKYKYVEPSASETEALITAYLNELESSINEVTYGHKKREIRSIYFGGGTPSLAKPRVFEKIINLVDSKCKMTRDTEISLEGNPSSLTLDRLREFKSVGVNRLSIGIQSLNPKDLILLNRDHSLSESIRVIEQSRNLFPGKVSLDFIWGRPAQSVNDWKNELEAILQLSDNHLSLYQLTLERGTPLFKAYEKRKVEFPSEAEIADMYDLTIELTSAAGFNHYEVSSFSRNNEISKHNTSYWLGLDYIGVGPGAHGRITVKSEANRRTWQRKRTYRILHPKTWLKHCISPSKSGLHHDSFLTSQESMQEMLLLSLRMKNGIDLAFLNSVWSSNARHTLQGRAMENEGADGVWNYLEFDAVIQLEKDGYLRVQVLGDNNDLKIFNYLQLPHTDRMRRNGEDFGNDVARRRQVNRISRIQCTDKGFKVLDSIIGRIIK